MMKFVSERLEPVALAKGRKSDVKAMATDSEIAQVRAVMGGLNWAAKKEDRIVPQRHPLEQPPSRSLRFRTSST